MRRPRLLALPVTTLALLALPAVAAADAVVPDDQIVQGSACVGLDCVDNESFGFDTLRLKENNTQIGFDDTSSTPGFPANDWHLIANDSSSGGRNVFKLEDTTAGQVPFAVMAGAGTNALFVGATGNTGLGTDSPASKLDVRGTARASESLLQGADPAKATGATAADGQALLAGLRTLPLTTQRYTSDAGNLLHLWPTAHDFTAAFGLGADDGTIAPGDMAGVALAAVQELDARVSALPGGTPGAAGAKGDTGAKGDAGATGAQGEVGAAGAAGAAGTTASTAVLLKRVKALEHANERLTTRLTVLRRSGKRTTARASARVKVVERRSSARYRKLASRVAALERLAEDAAK
ncbi:hypothetical protein [Patulibacter minatonensis]|uniref:hypothetical protein n=1 Tax=Patulibacter minatonensis TaxID=298163 RepID=UPI0004BA5BAB|nr:hypothetical protein [Patulibacter minatonensis]